MDFATLLIGGILVCTIVFGVAFLIARHHEIRRDKQRKESSVLTDPRIAMLACRAREQDERWLRETGYVPKP